MKKTKRKAAGRSKATHWKIENIDFDTYGRIVVKNPKLAALLKQHAKRGKDIYISSTNSGDFCVIDSGSGCTVKPPPSPPPLDQMCTCVAQCGCTNTLCNCA